MTIAAICALAAVVAPPAHAAVAPPGNSGIDEYVESIPTPGGNRPVQPGAGNHSNPLPAPARAALDSRGADGRAAARLAGATAPGDSTGAAKGRSTTGRSHGDTTTRAPSPAEPAGSPSVTRAVVRTLDGSDSGGLGLFLPAVLVVSTLVAVAVGVARRRTA